MCLVVPQLDSPCLVDIPEKPAFSEWKWRKSEFGEKGSWRGDLELTRGELWSGSNIREKNTFLKNITSVHLQCMK